MKLFLEKLLDILEALLRFRRRRNGKTESAVTKLMFLLGHGYTPDEVRDRMNRSMAGEITL